MKIQQLPPISRIYNFPQKAQPVLKNSPSNDTFVRQTIDIGSNGEYPGNVLSNFTESHFELDGIKINSMEGFLQALKTSDPEKQRKICQLIGIKAKRAGNKLKKVGYNFKNIFWQGQTIDRNSKDYQTLLNRAYGAKYNSDKTFRDALEATKGKALAHSIGKQDPESTILTEQEFIDQLNRLRKES